jgi:hypothetical protein
MTRFSRWLPLSLLAACALPDATDRADTTTPYAPEPAATAAPSLSPERAASAVPQVVALVMAADPNAMLAAYDAMMEHGDAACPGETNEGGVRAWFLEEPCTASDGTRFDGEGYLQRFTSETEDGFELGVELLDIVTADGAYLRGSFSIYASTFESGGERYHYFEVQADVHADAATAAGHPWLLGTSGTVSVEAEDAGSRRLVLHANFRTRGFDDIVAASFAELAIDDGDCALSVTGDVALRDGAGRWHDASYDASTCDTCGELRFGDTLLGGFCHDDALAGLLAWETKPW